MSRNAHFGDAFGVSRHEASEMHTHALAGHIWDKVMEPFGGEGGFRTSVQSEAYDRIRQSGYGAEHISIDNDRDGDSYVEHSSGPYRARWYGGTYADIHHSSDPGSAIDTLNIGHEAHPEKGTDLQKRLDDWHQDQAQHYR
jgi:hypothetical protein